ncbi:MAG: acetyl-CoA carboxylase carboxyltransferase subunit alpha [Candidatus Marinimicrobia bacterium]|nr:acetyl-CoA carboxylase carboxyltransferase subunit alpha [Candidatus Neomarinimicrobiota bacterium]MCF7880227.1 acetyl-CoA carboxylase carboxyltransferase subunit alpha [Candidatus Neomarinimicrobiota bacterium]
MQTVLDFEKPIVELEQKIEEMQGLSAADDVDIDDEVQRLQEKLKKLSTKVYSNLTRWQRYQLAKHPDRPYTNDYVERMCDDFLELHGDRRFGDDKAIISGIGTIGNQKVAIVGHQKGRNTKQNVYRNFGMPNPEGYRKALRVMKIAEKFNRPIVCLIDTPGAYPGIGAEERGQAEAIATNLAEMSHLKVPVLIVVIGEGASGGALGIGVGDRILMLENTWYSVISPEGCASILFKDEGASKAPEAAEAMKITAKDLMDMGIADRIIDEPIGGAHRNYEDTAIVLQDVILEEIEKLQAMDIEVRLQNRIEKYSKMGAWEE